jgi:predicted transglutaminase-like cysteine proteinase
MGCMSASLRSIQVKLVASVTAVLFVGCTSFKPPPDVSLKPYQAPPGMQSASYRGMLNKKQVEHLYNANFSRLSDTERKLMVEINREVNEDIIYLSDRENYGWLDVPVSEPRFRRPLRRFMPLARYGDCEDFALTKKQRLVARGLDASRLFVVRAKIPMGEGFKCHAVLVVPEGGEWWVLNNSDDRIKPASFLMKWWDWDFYSPSFVEYRRFVTAYAGAQ